MTTAEVAHPEDSLLPISVIQRAGEVIERIRHSETSPKCPETGAFSHQGVSGGKSVPGVEHCLETL